jgi:hypothetical protein
VVEEFNKRFAAKVDALVFEPWDEVVMLTHYQRKKASLYSELIDDYKR